MKLSFTELEPIYNTDYQKNGGAEYFGTKIAHQVATKRG